MEQKYDRDEEKLLRITEVDKNNLDEEWRIQGRTVTEYSIYLADATELVSDLKNQMDLKRSEVGSSARSSPEDYGIPKVTDNSIKEVVDADSEVQELVTELRSAERTVNVLKGAIKGLDHKKDGLTWNTKLFIMNYYADRIPGEVKDRLEDEETRDREEVHREYQDKFKKEKNNGD